MKITRKRDKIEEEIARLNRTIVSPNEKVISFLESRGSTPIKSGARLSELLKRPEISYEALAEIDEERPELKYAVREQVEISIKYEGYIKRQMQQVEQFKKLENRKIPEDIDYDQIKNLRIEARQKLGKIRPTSVGQASRIAGVTPADISVLMIYLEQFKSSRKHG